MSEVAPRAFERPLTALVATIQDGRFLKLVFLSLLALSVATVFLDLKDLTERSTTDTPGSQTLEPAPMKLPQPGDQTRPYLPRTMPLGPGREKPDLPGYFGPLDGTVMGEPLQFHMGDDGRASALGRIDPGAAERFEAFLEENPKAIGELFLHSPGGSVTDALAISRLVRNAGISTRVPKAGYCASSCPLLLAGGLYRSAGEPAFIGVHQVYAPAPASGTLQRGMADAQTVSAVAQQLLVDMDVEPDMWIKAMETAPADLYVFTPDELVRYNLANSPRAKTVPTPRPEPAI